MPTTNELSFLPDGYFEQKAQRRANAICAVLFLLVMGGIGTAFTLSERATKAVDAEFNRVEQSYLNEAKRIEQVRQMQEKQKRMAHQADLTASLIERVPRTKILAEITNTIPPGVSLLDLGLESKEAKKIATPKEAPKTAYELKKAARQAAASATTAPPPEPKAYDVTVKLTGIAGTDVQVAQYINNLQKVADRTGHSIFKDVNLVISEEYVQMKDTNTKEVLRKFQLEMTLNRDADVAGSAVPNITTTSIEVK